MLRKLFVLLYGFLLIKDWKASGFIKIILMYDNVWHMPCKPLKSSNKCIQKNLKIKIKKLLQEFRGLIVEVKIEVKKHSNMVSSI